MVLQHRMHNAGRLASVFDPQLDASDPRACHSPLALFSADRVGAANASHSAFLPEPETRNGLSLAHNDAFAPLRGQRSRPVPSLPPRKISSTRSIQNSSTQFGFRSRTGRNPHSEPVVPAKTLRAPVIAADIHSPSGFFDLPDQSVRSALSQETRLA
jgi:hypothetical protein